MKRAEIKHAQAEKKKTSKQKAMLQPSGTSSYATKKRLRNGSHGWVGDRDESGSAPVTNQSQQSSVNRWPKIRTAVSLRPSYYCWR